MREGCGKILIMDIYCDKWIQIIINVDFKKKKTTLIYSNVVLIIEDGKL